MDLLCFFFSISIFGVGRNKRTAGRVGEQVTGSEDVEVVEVVDGMF